MRFVIVVKAGPPKPQGTAEIYVDDSFLGSGTLMRGKLSVRLPMSLPPGPHTVRAIYDGLGSLSSSWSVPRTVTVT